ncbi:MULTISPECIES: hypothetical protein [Streptomycetaceae]|uniref:Uncharacterized protein n=1 Tax=Streptantibioticus cattleyicolor (strain ATCC 35852 / DSM 46488 / JCM 4925 / NBRC 14057 / NRRL 8057) TaxID=1003195 RepID=F8JSX9_STREN|nr:MULTISPECIES: hypothetical protein [Streptomycetaceae]AEW97841.1 hypothetical protein SCATT_54700 [Streptantibioticus cattleyicolor NRRL 8057 = DSM 46488]CCB78159.1 protein of unknown function [Streptantibioticus cattleyicolor NRRL 8057 = DSM 46488]
MPPATCPAALRQQRAQAAIRALTARHPLTPSQRLELARWQREWLHAYRDGLTRAA